MYPRGKNVLTSPFCIVLIVDNINRTDFEKLVKATLQNSFFKFEEKIYKQIDEVAMGSPLGTTLTNSFLYFNDWISANKCNGEFKPEYYRRSVDDILVLFRSPYNFEKLKNYLNFKHRNIRFTCEIEHNNFIPFSDVLITKTSNGFKTSVCHKPTFCGEYSNLNNFISEEYKIGLIFTLLFGMFSFVSGF